MASIRGLSYYRGVGVMAAVLLVGAGSLAAWMLARPAPAPPEATIPMATTTLPPPASTTAATVVAHAAGAVANPGVYELPSGARVADLIDAAGGAASEADLDRLNLAAILGDGARVYVPRIGEPDLPEPLPAGESAEPGGGSEELVRINLATQSQLESLPGIGPVTAAAIIEFRETVGLFGSVDELAEVPGIGEAKLEQIRPLVSVE